MKVKMLLIVFILLFVISCVPDTAEPITEDDLPPEPLPPGTVATTSGDLIGQAFYPYEQGYSSTYDVYEDNFQSQLFYINPSQFDLDLLTQTFDINVRVEHDNGIVFKTGYIHTRNGWEAFEFPQNTIGSSSWIRNYAETTISNNRDVFNDGTSWILAYSCKKHNGLWRCGAQFIGDSQGHWMLNSFFVRTVNVPLAPPGLGQPVISELRMSPTNRLVKLGDTVGITAYLESIQNVVHNIDDVNVEVREPWGGQYLLNLGVIHRQPFDSNTCTPLSGLYDYSVDNGCKEWAHYQAQFTPQDVGDYAIESQGLTLPDLRVDDGAFRVLQPWQFEQKLVSYLVTAPGVEFTPDQSYGYYYTEADEYFQSYTVSDTNNFNTAWMEANVNDVFDQNNYRVTHFEQDHSDFNEIVVKVDGQDHHILQRISVQHSSFNSQTSVSWAWKNAANNHVVRLKYWSDLNNVVDVTELVREYLRKFPTDLSARTSVSYAQYLIEQDIGIYDYKRSSFHEWAELRLPSQIGEDDMYVAQYEDFISLYNVERQQATVMVYDPANNVEAGLRDALDVMVADSNGQVNYWSDTKLDTNGNSHNVYIITGDSESVVWASNNYIVWIGSESRSSPPYSEDVVSAYLTMHESTMTGVSPPAAHCDAEGTILEGEIQSHVVDGVNYNIILSNFLQQSFPGGISSAEFDVNGEVFTLVEGDTYVLADGAVITLTSLLFQNYAGGVHSAVFCLNRATPCDIHATLQENMGLLDTVNGVNYDISISFIDQDEASFIVNGEQTNKLMVGDSYMLADSSEITVVNILYQNYAGGIHSVEFCFLGAGSTTSCDLNEIMIEGDIDNHVVNGQNYRFELVYVDDDEAEFEVSFDANVERTPKMMVGNVHSFSDGSTLEVNTVLYQSYTGGVHSAEYCFNRGRLTTPPLTPTGQSILTLFEDAQLLWGHDGMTCTQECDTLGATCVASMFSYRSFVSGDEAWSDAPQGCNLVYDGEPDADLPGNRLNACTCAGPTTNPDNQAILDLFEDFNVLLAHDGMSCSQECDTTGAVCVGAVTSVRDWINPVTGNRDLTTGSLVYGDIPQTCDSVYTLQADAQQPGPRAQYCSCVTPATPNQETILEKFEDAQLLLGHDGMSCEQECTGSGMVCVASLTSARQRPTSGEVVYAEATQRCDSVFSEQPDTTLDGGRINTCICATP